MTATGWFGSAMGLFLLVVGTVSLVLTRPSGRRAAAHPSGARAFRPVLVAEVGMGLFMLLLNGSRIAPDGLDIALAVAGIVAWLAACVLGIVGYRRWRRARTPAGTLFNLLAPPR
jgi:hypothetical protein